MKRQNYLLLGILLYMFMLSLLFKFNLARMIRPIPFIAVVSGMLILTLSQYKKNINTNDVLYFARWNALFSGLMTSLLSLLTAITEDRSVLSAFTIAEKLIPLIYGSIIYLVFDLILFYIDHIIEIERDKESNENPSLNLHKATDLLISKGFSPRECHVALKLLKGESNKEIAKQLFISEATVKKHIQNMFRKCEATDRQSFINLYKSWLNDKK